MSRKLSTLVLLGALVVAMLIGCSTIGGDLTDLPLSAVPNSTEDPRFANANVPAPGGGGGVGAGGIRTVVAVGTFVTQLGVALSLACPPQVNDVDCSDAVFACQQDAQDYFNAVAAATGQRDCHGLDGDNDGIACEELTDLCPGPAPVASVAPPAAPPTTFIGRDGTTIPLDCSTGVNCSTFKCRQQAQAYFEATGCQKLDGDFDLQACESAPKGITQAVWEQPCL